MPVTKKLVKPSRRHLLANTPRAQWDPLHPGPIAQRIKPNAVDAHGVRYELRDAIPDPKYAGEDKTSKTIRAWVRLPSAAQKRQRCFLCPGAQHNPKNETCAAFSKQKGKKTLTLYSFPAGKPLAGKWRRAHILVAPRYTSGTCTFTWRAS